MHIGGCIYDCLGIVPRRCQRVYSEYAKGMLHVFVRGRIRKSTLARSLAWISTSLAMDDIFSGQYPVVFICKGV